MKKIHIKQDTKFDKITFIWGKDGNMCELSDRTYSEALEIAKSFGFREFRWFNPITWGNVSFRVKHKDVVTNE